MPSGALTEVICDSYRKMAGGRGYYGTFREGRSYIHLFETMEEAAGSVRGDVSSAKANAKATLLNAEKKILRLEQSIEKHRKK